MLSLPIIGGMISQNILNLIDTAMVGRLGNAALAGVGVGGFAFFMMSALVQGISTGVQTIASRRIGEDRSSEAAFSLNKGLFLILITAIPLSLIYYYLVPWLFPYLNNDPDIILQGSSYLQTRTLSILFIGSNFAFRGYWNATNRAGLYFKTLVFMHLCNIVFNYLLIFGNFGFPALGTVGAAWGTNISLMLGTLYYFYLGFKHARNQGFMQGMGEMQEITTLIKISTPNGIQQTLFAAGLTAFYWIIGQIGKVELAAASIVVNIMLVSILPSIGLGLAAATLVGQSLGASSPKEAKQWAWDVVKVGIAVVFLIGTPMILFPKFLLSLFVNIPETIMLGKPILQFIGGALWIDAIGLILMNALFGAGEVKKTSMIAIGTQWLFFLPLAFIGVKFYGLGLLGVWILQAIYRLLQALGFIWLWQKEKWMTIKI